MDRFERRQQILEKKMELNNEILSIISQCNPHGRSLNYSGPPDPGWLKLHKAVSFDVRGDVVVTLPPEEIPYGVQIRQGLLSEYQKELEILRDDSGSPAASQNNKAVWLGQPGELAELVGMLRDSGWLDKGENLEAFFETVAACFAIKDSPSIKPHSLRVAYERVKDGSRKKRSIFEPLRKIKKL